MTGFSEDIFSFLETSEKRYTLSDLMKIFAYKHGISPLKVKKSIKVLVDKGDLEYINELGHTFPVLSFSKGVRLSKRVIAVPPDVSAEKKNPDDILINIEKSTSFGRGDHPTTRLSLVAAETFFEGTDKIEGDVLDVGCGTGILAIASVLMGMEMAYGVDIDPVAVFDAKKNIELNNLEEHVFISKSWPDRENFSIVFANLRPPTLTEFKESFKRVLKPGGALVLSGYKTDEEKGLLDEFKESFINKGVWGEKGWCSSLFKKS